MAIKKEFQVVLSYGTVYVYYRNVEVGKDDSVVSKGVWNTCLCVTKKKTGFKIDSIGNQHIPFAILEEVMAKVGEL